MEVLAVGLFVILAMPYLLTCGLMSWRRGYFADRDSGQACWAAKQCGFECFQCALMGSLLWWLWMGYLVMDSSGGDWAGLLGMAASLALGPLMGTYLAFALVKTPAAHL